MPRTCDDLARGAVGRTEQPAESPGHGQYPRTMNMPNGAIFSNIAPIRAGKTPATSTRPPSSGGIGSRLNTASNTLT